MLAEENVTYNAWGIGDVHSKISERTMRRLQSLRVQVHEAGVYSPTQNTPPNIGMLYTPSLGTLDVRFEEGSSPS